MDLDKYIYAFVLLLNLVVIADFVDVITMESDWRMCLFIFILLYIFIYIYFIYIYIYVEVYVNLDIECSMPLWQSKV